MGHIRRQYGAGPFVLDLAACADDAVAPHHIGPERGSLSCDWTAEALAAAGGGWAWCNPPYSRGVGPWVAKAREEVARGLPGVVLCLQYDPSTQWWARCRAEGAECIRVEGGRLAYLDPDTGRPVAGGRGATVLVVVTNIKAKSAALDHVAIGEIYETSVT